jgi:long-subunit acyl-CoA synthetase (AMP-forming)
VVAIGEGRRYLTALLTLEPTAVVDLSEAEIHEHLDAAVERANRRLSSAERVRRFTVLGPAWQPDGEELTPTAKVRRRVIAAKYADQIEALYT